jgi:GTP-binding protein
MHESQTPAALFRRACFLTGARRAGQFPEDHGAEVAFTGRSNAGKSSALNTLTGNRALARTSKTPGRTQEINFFRLDEHRRLVDLPGYGYARAPAEVRQQWSHTLQHYLEHRHCLRGLVLVMDARHPFMPFDQQLVDWCTALTLPLHILLTKADKLGTSRGMATLLDARRHLSVRGHGCSIQLFSAAGRQGVGELAAQVLAWLGQSPDA